MRTILILLFCLGVASFVSAETQGALREVLARRGVERSFLVVRDSLVELYLYEGGDHDLSKISDLPIDSLYVGYSGLTNIEALAGMSLQTLDLAQNSVCDLRPLRGMPLEVFASHSSVLSDVTPLQDSPIAVLDLAGTDVHDFAVLRSLPLKVFRSSARVPDSYAFFGDLNLTVLHTAGWGQSGVEAVSHMPLVELGLFQSTVTDLSAVTNMPLRSVAVQSRRIEDVSPLCELQLSRLFLDTPSVTNLFALRNSHLDWFHLASPKDLASLSGMNCRTLSYDFYNETSVRGIYGLLGLSSVEFNGYVLPASAFLEAVESGGKISDWYRRFEEQGYYPRIGRNGRDWGLGTDWSRR